MIAEESRHAGNSRMGNRGNQNNKQRETEDQIYKIEESVPAAEA